MSVRGDRRAEREVPAGGVRYSPVLGKEGGPGGKSDRAMVAGKPGDSGGAKGPALRHASDAEQGRRWTGVWKGRRRSATCRRSFISKRPLRGVRAKRECRAKRQACRYARPFSRRSAQAPGAEVPLLAAGGQGLAQRHSRARLAAGEGQRRGGGSGRRDVSADRVRGSPGVVAKPARRVALEELPASAGATGEDSQARRRPTSARHPDRSDRAVQR